MTSFRYYQREIPKVCHYCVRTITGTYRYVMTDAGLGPVHDPDCRPTMKQIKGFTLVRRNDDKPHRCPWCHVVAPWRMGQDRIGRSRVQLLQQMWCANCQVRWFSGRLGDWFGRKLDDDLYDDDSL